MCAAFVAGVDGAPVFEFSEHILEAMSLAVECQVVQKADLAAGVGRDARLDAATDQILS